MNADSAITTIRFQDMLQNTSGGPIEVHPMREGAAFHNWNIPSHRHRSMYQMFLVTEGSGEVEFDGRIDRIQVPWLVWLPVNTVHALRLGPDTDGFLLTISADYLLSLLCVPDGLIGDIDLFEVVHSRRLEPDRIASLHVVTYLSLLMGELRDTTPETGVAATSLLKLVLVAVARLAAEQGASTTRLSAGARMFHRFRHLVEQRFREHLSVKEFADLLCIAEQQLHAVCKAATDKPPQGVLHDRLMLEAKRHLLYSSLTVSETAFTLGFEDPAYFSRFFTKRAGTSPSLYRLNAASRIL